MDKIYGWQSSNNMKFNLPKFKWLQFGTRPSSDTEYNYFGPDLNEIFTIADEVKDLGIVISPDGSFHKHIAYIISKVNQRVGMLLRTFNNRSIEFMKFCWMTYIQPIIDYGSQLWAPYNGSILRKLENTLKSFSSKINGLKHLDYWTRLKKLRMYSIQRRFERYRTIYCWKISQGLVPNCDMEWNNTSQAGLTFIEPTIKEYQNNNRKNSFHYVATRLFNGLPRNIRDQVEITKDEFKALLDDFYSQIPDNPHFDDLIPEPCDRVSAKPCNSIITWTRFLKLSDRRTQDESAYISL